MGMIIMNGKEYTSSPKDGFPPLVYSDEEREVGVWRDGKPLYQKTFIKQLSGTTAQIDISSINADTIFIYTGYYDMGVTKLALNEWMGTSVYTYTHINPTSQHYNIDCYCSIAQNTTIYITVQYTKTTDIAGSGKYTSYGGLTHHYSTTEQVVGTWIDGKPLYERTFNLTSGITIGSYAYINVDNSVLIKKYDGCIVRASGKSVDKFNGYLDGNELKMSIRSQGIEYYIPSVFSNIEILFCIIQYTKTTD